MKQIIPIILTLMIISCENSLKENQVIKVDYKGALKNIMRKGDLSAKFDLTEFQETKNLFALGAIENLKGEIQIFNGMPFNTFVQDDSIIFDNTYSKKATLIVSSIVKDWKMFPIPNHVKSMSDLEEHIEIMAKENQINIKEPFPFLIEGKPESLDWHIINWKDGDTDHTHEKHIKSVLHGTIQDQEVEMLGFYSDSHHAIFTHHTTNMHIHMRMKNGEIAGHVDDLKIGNGMVLKLPGIN